MQEEEIKKSLIEHFLKNRIEYLEETNLGGCVIDFLIKSNNMWIGVEVKGDHANDVSALGQLLNYYRHLSHIMLCAPEDFIRKIKNLISSNPELAHIDKILGLITASNNEMIFSWPQNPKYYFFIREGQKERNQQHSKFPKYGRLDNMDTSIIKLVENRGKVMLGEIVKSMGLSYENTRKKVKNLDHFGYLKIISRYPTSVSVGVNNEKRTP